MSDKGKLSSLNSSNNNNSSNADNSRILGGRGTHNRPWIVEDDSNAGNRTTSSQQQQQRRQYLLHQNLLAGTATTSARVDVTNTASSDRNADQSASIRRATLASEQQLRPYGQTVHINSNNDSAQRRSSTSDIRSVASGDSGSSYDRYLAQKRTAKEQRQQQLPATPSSPILEKHYTTGGKAVILSANAVEKQATKQSKYDETIRSSYQSDQPNSTSTRQSTISASLGRLQQQRLSATITEEEKATARDLRARRLLAAQQSRSGTSNSQNTSNFDRIDGIPTTISTKPQSKNSSKEATASSGTSATIIPLHFQAHDAAVEKYLMRSRTDPGRSRASSSRNHDNSVIEPQHRPISSSSSSTLIQNAETFTASSTTQINSNKKSDTSPAPVSMNSKHIPNTLNIISESRTGLANEMPSKSASATRNDKISEGPVLQSQSGWSTMKPASSTGYHNVTSDAIAKHDAYNADSIRSTTQAVPLGSGSSKVDEYLAQRNALKAKVDSMTRLKKETINAKVKPPQPPIMSVPSASVSFDESTDMEDGDEQSDSEIDDSIENIVITDEYHSCVDHSDPSKEWGIKVCVISAIDFPASVVPNLPFSPMLKFGLLKIEQQDTPRSTEKYCKELAKTIEKNGLASIPNARMRCTTSKILSKRDNGAVEFHEEIRWDRVIDTQNTVITLELSSRAVLSPANSDESPPQQKVGPFLLSPTIPSSIIRPNATQKPPATKETTTSVIGSMFRSIRKNDSAEMEEANAAAAVAQHLVRGDTVDTKNDGSGVQKSKGENQNEINVKLRKRKASRRVKFSEEFRIGSKVIPLSSLPLDVAMNNHETVRIEQWFELDTCTNTVKTSLVGTNPTPSTAIRNPSVLLEISVSTRDKLDESEDDMDEGESKTEMKASYSKRASFKIRKQLKQEVKPKIEKAVEPLLEPGIIDFVCVVGARDIGDQKHDDGSSGWVNSNPDCCILEQFPPDDEFHTKRGRNAVLAGKIEWFCFPEGCKLWRGLTPPNHDELNLKRFSASTAGNISSSVASFDAALECTSSFCWFVIASSSDKYGSENKKTYGAVIRFFVPAPPGIDATQDDFAQTLIGNINPNHEDQNDIKRLWVPMGICMTSSLPIVGTMEVMLLRLCESLSSTSILSTNFIEESKAIREAIICAIISFQKPIPGVVNCSIPFLKGDRLHLAIPARTGLPALPHGRSVSAVCRLLGADGINFLLAALLTECKILLHSSDVANLSMVAEVLTSLMYPFEWALPYVPVLPTEMMEFVEAPVSFLIGVASCNMLHVDPCVLEDVVVVDLDNDFATSDYFEGRWNGLKTKSPVPLPASVASNIAKAAHRLIRVDDELEASGAQLLPRLEPETLPEKEFRVAVALEVCSLIRGFDECLVFSSSQPVFNVDKFLQIAPSIFEEQRDVSRDMYGHNQGNSNSRSVISSRSRRFVSSLVCCQHFHQFLDVLECDSLSFFHIIMRTLHANSTKKERSLGGMLRALEPNHSSSDLCKMLLKVEDKTPTYRVKSLSGQWGAVFDSSAATSLDDSRSYFPLNLLQQIDIRGNTQHKDAGSDGVKSVSVEYLVELEKNPWRYRNLFNLKIDESSLPPIEKVKLREAIGDRRYKAWKSGYDKFDGDDGTVISDDTTSLPTNLDLRNLLATAALNFVESDSINDETAVLDAKDRDTIRRCIEYPKRDSPESMSLIQEAEIALQNPASRRFILEILSKRVRKDEKRKNESTPTRRRSLHYGGSKIDAALFDLLVRLSFAMLDSCDDSKDFESAYLLLKHSAGLYAALNETGTEINVVYVTERIGLHPIYGNLLLWQSVKEKHSSANPIHSNTVNKQNGDTSEDTDDEYEAVVATLYEMNGYGIPAKDLARFASRMCDCNGWFHSEKGQTILMLAKRVAVRRDAGGTSSIPATISDLALISQSPRKKLVKKVNNQLQPEKLVHKGIDPSNDNEWVSVGWCHPAAQSSRRNDQNRRTAQNLSSVEGGILSTSPINSKSDSYMKRSAVTSMAYLGSSVVVTGGLDGGVFLARKVRCNVTADSNGDIGVAVRGIHLDWGSSGSRYSVGSTTATMDGEYGVGAVTCVAATQSTIANFDSHTRKDVVDGPLSDEEVLESMEGCRVVAGTTCGDLRVWSIRDVFTAVFYANRTSSGTDTGSTSGLKSSGISSSIIQNKVDHSAATDFAAGTSLTRLKFSLRGRALSGHRGGVSCIAVHSNIYRPDSIVSGGADGLIKLWSLRTPGTSGGRRSSVDPTAARNSGSLASQNRTSTATSGGSKVGVSGTSTGDALSILSGHGGRIICIKSAWHGDRLLSGGADRTVRLWDLAAGSGGKCLNALSGHFGWVTYVDYWGQNTIVSTSTDRSIGLWDVRVGSAPLYQLRHHNAVVSSLLVEPHCDATLISAAMDGSVASWDLRQLTYTSKVSNNGVSKVVRNPSCVLYSNQLHLNSNTVNRATLGPVHLTKGVNPHRKTVQSLGGDAVVREWDYGTGEVLTEYTSGHCDSVSSFVAIANDRVVGPQLECVTPGTTDAMISASWDGTIRMRSLVSRNDKLR